MTSPAVLIGGVAALAYLANERGDQPDPPKPGPTLLRPLAGVSVSLAGANPGGKGSSSSAFTVGLANKLRNSVYTGVGKSTKGNSALDQAVERGAAEIEKKITEEIDKLSAEAKKKGAEALNKELKLNPPLTGNEKAKDIVAIASAAAAAAGCGAIPGVGAAVAPLCAIAGAYLGKKGYELAAEAWARIEDDVREAWDDVQEGVKDAARATWRWIT